MQKGALQLGSATAGVVNEKNVSRLVVVDFIISRINHFASVIISRLCYNFIVGGLFFLRESLLSYSHTHVQLLCLAENRCKIYFTGGREIGCPFLCYNVVVANEL